MYKRNKSLLTIIKIILAIVILIIIVIKGNVNTREVFNSIVDYYFFVIAMLFPTLITTSISANRWKSFLEMINVKESFKDLAMINFTSTFIGLILPSSQGFDLLRIYQIEKKHPEMRGKVGSTVIVERIIGLLCLLGLALISWGCVGNDNTVTTIISLSLVLSFIILIIKNKNLYIYIQKKLTKIPYGKPFVFYLSTLYEGVHTFPFNKKLSQSIILILLLQLSNILTVALLFSACNCHIDFVYHLCYQPLISLLTMMPVTFGGVGIREGAFIYFYSSHNISNSTLIAISLLYYFVVSIIPAFIGGLIYLFSEIKKE